MKNDLYIVGPQWRSWSCSWSVQWRSWSCSCSCCCSLRMFLSKIIIEQVISSWEYLKFEYQGNDYWTIPIQKPNPIWKAPRRAASVGQLPSCQNDTGLYSSFFKFPLARCPSWHQLLWHEQQLSTQATSSHSISSASAASPNLFFIR